jgi:ricin-type beta-trefoil lectin protein
MDSRTGIPAKSPTSTPPFPPTTKVTLMNVHTNQCMDDSLFYGLQAFGCNPNVENQRFFITTHDGGRTWVLQNLATGSCVDDSLAYGLRGWYCNNLDYQEFLPTHRADGSWVLQNLHTGSCIDDSLAYGLRGYYCNNLDYQTVDHQRLGPEVADGPAPSLPSWGEAASARPRLPGWQAATPPYRAGSAAASWYPLAGPFRRRVGCGRRRAGLRGRHRRRVQR